MPNTDIRWTDRQERDCRQPSNTDWRPDLARGFDATVAIAAAALAALGSLAFLRRK